MGRTTEGRGLIGGTKGTLLVGKVGPFLVLSVCSQLASGVKTTGFASSHFCFKSLVERRCGKFGRGRGPVERDCAGLLEYLPDLSVYRRRVGDGNLRRLQKVGTIDQPKLQVGFCGPRKGKCY